MEDSKSRRPGWPRRTAEGRETGWKGEGKRSNLCCNFLHYFWKVMNNTVNASTEPNKQLKERSSRVCLCPCSSCRPEGRSEEEDRREWRVTLFRLLSPSSSSDSVWQRSSTECDQESDSCYFYLWSGFSKETDCKCCQSHFKRSSSSSRVLYRWCHFKWFSSCSSWLPSLESRCRESFIVIVEVS